MLFNFWVLSMSHADGHESKSVFTHLKTLMEYWGHVLTDLDLVQDCTIEQKYIYCSRFTDQQDSLIQVSLSEGADEVRWVTFYFMDVREVYEWQKYQETHGNPTCLRFEDMVVKTLMINRDDLNPPLMAAPGVKRVRKIDATVPHEG